MPDSFHSWLNSRICVSIGSTSWSELVSVAKEHDFVEFRLDLLPFTPEALSPIFQQIPRVIAACHGTHHPASVVEDRLIAAIENGVTHIDVAIDEKGEINRNVFDKAKHNGCKVIISYHNFHTTPSTTVLDAIVTKAQSYGADVVKIATEAKDHSAMNRIYQLYHRFTNIVAFGMGEFAQSSRLHALRLGAPFAFVALTEESKTAKGQFSKDEFLSLWSTKSSLFFDKKLFGVAGKPILHSKSPAIWSKAFEVHHQDALYAILHTNSPSALIKMIKIAGYAAVSVTAPLKERVIPLLDYVDPLAEELQSVNFIINKEGELSGYNTDVVGVAALLAMVDIQQKRVVVVGSGGAVPAVLKALQHYTKEVVVIARNRERGGILETQFGGVFGTFLQLQEAVNKADVIINCLPNHAVEEQMAGIKLSARHTVIDSSYSSTYLKEQCSVFKSRYHSGEGWLITQAQEAYKIFFGVEPLFLPLFVAFKGISLPFTTVKLQGKGSFSGTITAPSSKSMMQRALLLAFLSEGKTVIKNPDFSNDSLALLQLIEQLGVRLFFSNDVIIAEKTDTKFADQLFVGESGLATRLSAALATLLPLPITIVGEGSLLTRSMKSVIDALQSLGFDVDSNKGMLPITIAGKRSKSQVRIDGSETSQMVSGLLFAMLKWEERSTLLVDNLKSKPYVDLTLDMIQQFGGSVVREGYHRFEVAGNELLIGGEISIEGDWSAAAFHLVAAALAGEVALRGLNSESKQADRAIESLLKKVGADVSWKDNLIYVKRKALCSFDFDATDCPDLFPPLVVLALGIEGVSTIKGVTRLSGKESDRAVVLQQEFSKMGADIRVKGDIMSITGTALHPALLNSHHDHRIVMAAAVSSLLVDGEVEITDADVVAKSYPTFFKDFEFLIGGHCVKY